MPGRGRPDIGMAAVAESRKLDLNDEPSTQTFQPGADSPGCGTPAAAGLTGSDAPPGNSWGCNEPLGVARSVCASARPCAAERRFMLMGLYVHRRLHTSFSY